jgi:hypothetical protein
VNRSRGQAESAFPLSACLTRCLMEKRGEGFQSQKETFTARFLQKRPFRNGIWPHAVFALCG